MRDIYGNTVPAAVWHASTPTSLPETMPPASSVGGWWHVIDHETYLDPPTADDPDFRGMADGSGLHGLGDEVTIFFASGDRAYVERYGEAMEMEIDFSSPSLLAMIPDDKVAEDRLSWLLVLKAGASFPAKQASGHPP